MRYIKYQVMTGIVTILLFACKQSPPYDNKSLHHPLLYSQTVKQLTDVIVHDIFSPPVACRIYAYAAIAGYEVMAHGNQQYQSLGGQLHGLPPTPVPKDPAQVDFPLAAMIAVTATGKAMIFSEDSLQAVIDSLKAKAAAAGMPGDMIKSTVVYGQQVSAAILAWSKGDHYAQTRAGGKYTVTEEEGRWTPTPPAYMSAIEPHWNELRPFVLDSAGELLAARPPVFNMKDTSSAFFRMVQEIYTIGNTLTEAQINSADFWDCNPYKVNLSGHVSFATKKITPGGHWINICGIAAQNAKADFAKTTCTYAKVAIALSDAFIVCWDEKFRSNLIRPETVINKYLDENWKPHLQTPPFPEYTSGHSVASAAAATVLTQLYGEPFPFRDSSEVEFGLPEREFSSFIAASDDAATSRLYGGIHFRPAVEEGTRQGRLVGQKVITKLKMERKKL